MINIWDVFEYNLVRINKHQSGRSFTPEDFNLVAKMVNYAYYKVKVGLPESYQPGAPFPPQAWQVSMKITEDMQPFIKWLGGPNYPFLAIDRYGFATIPSDYVAFSSCYYELVSTKEDCEDDERISPRTVEFLTDAVFADRVQSVIKFPEKKYPIAKWAGNGKLYFEPKNLRMVHFTYLREPVEPVLGYTIDGNGDIVYSPSTSVQFEWPQVTLTDIANLIFLVMSENLKSQLDIQLAVDRQMKGQ